MAVFKDKCLVVLNQGKTAKFISNENDGRLMEKPTFNLDNGKPLTTILLVENHYVIAVFDTLVQIYSALSGDLLQEEGRLDGKSQILKFKYRTASIKLHANNETISEVYLNAYKTNEKKGTVFSEIYYMKEVGWEQQVDSLLYAGRIDEAK